VNISDLQKTAEFLRDNDDFLLLAHVNPDGDAIGSTLGLAHLLTRLGKTYTLFAEEPIPLRYRFLSGSQGYVTSGQRLHQVAVALDCGDRLRMGKAIDRFAEDVTLLNIDHHSTNDHFGNVYLIDTSASATSEIVYYLVKHMGIPFDQQIASCLYAGIVFDTGGFRYNNTSSDVLRAAAELLETGINAFDIADQVLEMMTWSELQLTREALTTLHFNESERTATIVVTLEMMAKTSSVASEVEGLVGYTRGLRGVEVGVLFRELPEGKWKISLRSKREVNVAEVACTFGGGGHVRAAGCIIAGSLHEVREKVLDAVRVGFAHK